MPLASAIRDAGEVEQWLVNQNGGGGLPTANCKTILSKPDSDRPLNDDIDEAFADIVRLVEQRPNRARRFYLYFSGHGMATSWEQAYLCLPKWSGFFRLKAIDSRAYCQALANTGLFQEIVCWFDCCRSYKPNVGGQGPSWGMSRPDRQAAGTKQFIGFAAEFLERAYEAPEVDGHSFFTRALLSGLRGGACRSQGGAPAERLKIFLENETRRLAELAGKRQTPTVNNGLSSVNDPVFGSALPIDGTGANKLMYAVSVSNAPSREVVLVRPDETELWWDGSQPWRIEVGGGLHLLEDKLSGTTFRLPRDVTQGEIHVEF